MTKTVASPPPVRAGSGARPRPAVGRSRRRRRPPTTTRSVKPIRSDSVWSRNPQATVGAGGADAVRRDTAPPAARRCPSPSRVNARPSDARQDLLVGRHPAETRLARRAAPSRPTPSPPTARARPAGVRTAARAARPRAQLLGRVLGMPERARAACATAGASAGRCRVSHSSGRIGW